MYGYFSKDEVEILSDLLSHICDITPDEVFNENKSNLADVITSIKHLDLLVNPLEIFEVLEWIKNVLHYDDFWNWSTREILAVGKVKTLYNSMTSGHDGRGYGYDEEQIIKNVLGLYIGQYETKDLPEIRRIIRTISGGALVSEDYRLIKSVLLESVRLIQEDSELCTKAALVIVQTDAIIKYRETHDM